MIEYLDIVIKATLGGLVGWIFMMIQDLKRKIDTAVTLEEVKELMKTRLEIVEVKHSSHDADIQGIEKSIDRIEKKLDKLILRD